MSTNTAAWLTGSKVAPLEVKSAPYTSPHDNEIVIKTGAVAINPVDWMIQDRGTGMMFTWLKYPFVLGTDAAGTIVEIGSRVTRFKVGDRVVGHAVGSAENRNNPAEGAFQTYAVLQAHMATPIPSTMSFEVASVLPLGASTAACGLFQEDQLALNYPSMLPKPTGKTLLIWGGSTSVGSNAIQLAVAAGYEVFTTASPKNFDYVKHLGASKVFDYNSKTVVSDVTRAFEGKITAGAFSIGAGAADACMDVLNKCKGDKFVAMASYPMPSPEPTSFVVLKTAYCFVSWCIANWIKSKARGIRYKFIFATTLVDNGVGKIVYEDFLPEALAEGRYVAAPDPIVVGKGLEFIQAGFDLQKKGMSAKKVVVSL
jgi:NADPH:quinone reductase-like Zn-dependent oxidoreductase